MLYIQDPSFEKAFSTHEALICASQSSIRGYGAYAFASPEGVKILLNDEGLTDLLDQGSYSLIVGIDEITTIQCLELLSELEHSKPGLNVRAYYRPDQAAIFHPKVSFFGKSSGGGSLVIGSGNLTLRGLRQNTEAFALIDLSEEEFSRMEDYWNAWRASSNEHLRDLGDKTVIAQAHRNKLREQPTSELPILETEKAASTQGIPDTTSEFLITEGWHYGAQSRVLFAEIPQSGNRWKQANFDIGTFENFFGASPGNNSQRILLRNLNEDMTISPIEVRQSVSVRSQNYRFELDAATGLAYPSTGRPIGVFVQVAPRMFLYHLYMPTHELHAELSDWMKTNSDAQPNRMKRIVVPAGDADRLLNKTVFRHYRV